FAFGGRSSLFVPDQTLFEARLLAGAAVGGTVAAGVLAAPHIKDVSPSRLIQFLISWFFGVGGGFALGVIMFIASEGTVGLQGVGGGIMLGIAVGLALALGQLLIGSNPTAAPPTAPAPATATDS